jgi:hypothetical protein
MRVLTEIAANIVLALAEVMIIMGVLTLLCGLSCCSLPLFSSVDVGEWSAFRGVLLMIGGAFGAGLGWALGKGFAQIAEAASSERWHAH